MPNAMFRMEVQFGEETMAVEINRDVEVDTTELRGDDQLVWLHADYAIAEKSIDRCAAAMKALVNAGA